MSETVQETEEVYAEETASVEEELKRFYEELKQFEAFWNVYKGKVDVKNRLSLLLNPETLETSTNLTKSQVEFVTLSLFAAESFPQFEPLADYAKKFCQVMISREGWGVESSIRFNSAISESKMFRSLMVGKTQEGTKEFKGKA